MTDVHDEILQKPVLNKDTVKEALQKSTTRCLKIKNMTVRDAIISYPYLEVADLVRGNQ